MSVENGHFPLMQLKRYVDGLWLPSETEAPWTVPTWELATGSETELLRVLRRGSKTPIAEISLDELRAHVQQRCHSYGAAGRSLSQQHQDLFDWLQQTCDRVQVFRVGTVTIDIVVIGIIDNHYVALQTQSVET
ncbi:MAG: nuclease A inhibitor family protein [Cyanobacteria bacterium P01_F01_bin.56]